MPCRNRGSTAGAVRQSGLGSNPISPAWKYSADCIGEKLPPGHVSGRGRRWLRSKDEIGLGLFRRCLTGARGRNIPRGVIAEPFGLTGHSPLARLEWRGSIAM